ncbi:hypothetical protein DL96DRAFT_1247434 [Flagelloscypha sp. PMI_526]|nr:hypothetical protein DL96DRAFT_1247434 [Flagelloscypha sp. PMI_526]
MPGRLPLELLPDILCFISGSCPKYTLKLCSLVNRDFRHPSQALLFEDYTIDLTSESGSPSRSVLALNRRRWAPIFHHIKVLIVQTQDELSFLTGLMPDMTRLTKKVPSLRRLRLVVRSQRDGVPRGSPALSESLFENLLPLVNGRIFDLDWNGPPKGTSETERLNTLLGAAGRIDYLYISNTSIVELLSDGPPILPALFHFSSDNAEDAGVLPSRLELSNCRSLSLKPINWLLPVTNILFGSTINHSARLSLWAIPSGNYSMASSFHPPLSRSPSKLLLIHWRLGQLPESLSYRLPPLDVRGHLSSQEHTNPQLYSRRYGQT